jgi:hypothetical protein
MRRRVLLLWAGTLLLPAARASDAQAEARAKLEGPLRFLLRLPGWQIEQFTHESDLFSSWGRAVLSRRAGSVQGARAQATRAARAAGMTRGPPPDGAEVPDLEPYGVEKDAPELTLWRSTRGRAPTRYLARLWFSREGTRIVALWRVDGE